MRRLFYLAATMVFFGLIPGPTQAHFGMIIPSDQMVMQQEAREISLDIRFWHPFEGTPMNLEKPARFGVMVNGRAEDLTPRLAPAQVQGHRTWTARYKLLRPGIYAFYMEPQPYWEPAEDCFIVHYTKVVVTAFGDDEGWDRELGLKTEIVPLSKPYGQYSGNVFQGIVKLNGKPVPYAKVEVEYFNAEKTYTAPSEYMVAQTIKADGNGVFTYAAPKPGWWGFAALNASDTPMKHQGKDKDVELGAVIWVRFHDMK